VVRVGEVGAGNIAKLATRPLWRSTSPWWLRHWWAGVDPASVFEAIKGGLPGIELPKGEPQA